MGGGSLNRTEKAQIVRAALSAAKHRAGWMRARCPFCQGRDDSLSYNPESSVYHCFRCRTKGALDRKSDEDLVFAKPEQSELDAQQEALKRPPEGFVLLAEDDSETLEDARAYMRSRGIPRRVWREAQVGACPFGPYAGRIVIPNLLPDGSWYGYTTRAYDKGVPKKFAYRYPKGTWRGDVLHNQPALWADTDEHVYVVEGAFDALFLWPHAVAVMGMPSERQVQILATSTRPLVVVLDADAWEKGLMLSMRLRLEGCQAGCVRLLDGADPDEVDPAWLWEEARASISG